MVTNEPLTTKNERETMLELRFIRENIELVRQKTILRGIDPALIDRFTETDEKRLELLAEVETLKNRRNVVSREIAELKQAGNNEQAEPLISEMRDVSSRIKDMAPANPPATSAMINSTSPPKVIP